MEDFFALLVARPQRSEQMAVAEVIGLAEDRVRACGIQLEQLRSEKRALMQQLLTGKRRVKV